ncbi:carboxylesterase [Bradyrhizobium sp. CB1015]|uniref:alpha/beta hydrolase n=1 Tax=Bradyrhizobium sp. CB1015 TaxID=2976822 RepID=UPI0021A9A476|nr:alpha/beta fold hydrolase [Bradyrhizobium sp. CB1015]UWU95730.1 alpha/beta fold hydrolase [Bradyrhizobium sp. CB1015]
MKQSTGRIAPAQGRDLYRPSRQYRAGRVNIWDDAHTYRIEAGDVGVVLMHATFGSPWEMRPLAEFLVAHGITVVCPLFQGHGSTPEAFASANPAKWIDDARRALRWLKERTTKQFLVGQCLGGRVAMALHVEDGIDVAGIVTISTPFTAPPRMPFLPSPFDRWPIDLMPRSMPLFHRLNLVPDNTRRINLHSLTPWRCYQLYRPASAWEIVNRLRAKLSTQLHRVNVPCLIVHAEHDHLHPVENAHYAYQRISSADKELYTIDAVTHIVSTNVRTRHLVFKKVLRFIQDRTGVVQQNGGH